MSVVDWCITFKVEAYLTLETGIERFSFICCLLRTPLFRTLAIVYKAMRTPIQMDGI